MSVLLWIGKKEGGNKRKPTQKSLAKFVLEQTWRPRDSASSISERERRSGNNSCLIWPWPNGHHLLYGYYTAKQYWCLKAFACMCIIKFCRRTIGNNYYCYISDETITASRWKIMKCVTSTSVSGLQSRYFTTDHLQSGPYWKNWKTTLAG